MFSRTSEYALRAVVLLAHDPAARMTTERLARETRVPARYLSKVLRALGRSGLIESQRGTGGGFRLARPPTDISVLDVVGTVDPIQRLTRCPLGLREHGKRMCPLHRRLDGVIAEVERALQETAIAELLRASQRPPLCRPVPSRARKVRDSRGPKERRTPRRPGRTPRTGFR